MYNTELQQEIKQDEGLVLLAYRDTLGHLTIGHGRCLDTNPLNTYELNVIGHDCTRLPITKKDAHFLFMQDYVKAVAWVNGSFQQLPKIARDVLINMTYNIGPAGVMKFRRMTSNLKAQNYEQAANELLNSLWARQVKSRAVRLAEKLRSCAGGN